MSTGGYLQWDSRFLSGVPYLDGQAWTAHGTPLGMTWEESPHDMAFVIPTASGEHVLQAPFSGVASSDQPSRYIFELPVQLIHEETYFRLLRAKRKGAAVQFVPYLWDEEHFDNAQVSDVFSLSRPLAWTVVPGVSSVTHPAIFYKDGAVDTDCASLGGTLSQVLTVAEAGDIAVRYMPVFNVVVRDVSSQFEDVNGAVATVTLEEVRRYAGS
jgi:hypothetical protein